MTSRRNFLAGMLAVGALPRPSWADVGAPEFLAAGKVAADAYVLAGLKSSGEVAFQIPLPGRGHAAAAHPERPEAVAFARRPGTFAMVLDCRSGAVLAQLNSPEGRHFYGHGAFSEDGQLLYTAENAYDDADGRIGIWDVAAGYVRVGEFASGGVGPHDLRVMPGGKSLVIANGGIETHPASGRAKLNIPMMAPNLAYLDLATGEVEIIELRRDWHLNSIRHLAVRSDGLVAAAMQWEGDIAKAPPLLMLHRRGSDPLPVAFEAEIHRGMNGYAGSIAMSRDGRQVAITSPRGSMVQCFDTETGTPMSCLEQDDVCGVAPTAAGLITTSGSGQVARIDGTELSELSRHAVAWDNHLVPLSGPFDSHA